MSSAVQILHKDRIPTTGCLVVPGRLDASELPQLISLFPGRAITWLIEESTALDPQLGDLLGKSGSGAAFSDDDSDPAAAGEQLKPSIADGGVLIFVPGKFAARPSVPCHIPGKTLTTLGTFGLPVLPIAIDYPQESALSIERPKSLPRAILAVGNVIPSGKSSGSALRQGLLEAAEEAFSSRSFLKGSLAMALLEGLKKHGKRTKVHDGSDDSTLGFDRLLAAALVLSKHIKEETDNPRVGVILPPGKAGLVANLAVMFAGKTPVNLNFTASHEAIRSAMRQAGIDRYITADPFVRKIASFHGHQTAILSLSSGFSRH